jgi:hypothetical protein
MPDIKVVWDNAKWFPEINSFVFTCPICSRSYSSKLFLRTGYFQQACEKHLQSHEMEAINGWEFCGLRDMCAHAANCHGPVKGSCSVQSIRSL